MCVIKSIFVFIEEEKVAKRKKIRKSSSCITTTQLLDYLEFINHI